MNKLINLCFLSLLTLAGTAQTNVDSLENIMRDSKLPPKERVLVYDEIIYYYLGSDPQKAMSYSQEALSFAEKEKNKSWISAFNSYLGRAYEIKGDYDTALVYYTKALDIATDGNIEHILGHVYINMASLHWRLGNMVTTLDLFMKALSIYEKKEDVNYKRQLIHVLSNIGAIHRVLESPDNAISYFKKAEAIAEELNDPAGKIKVYYDLGNAYRNKDEYDKALDYILRALELCRQTGDKYTEFAALGELSTIYESGFNDYTKAEQYADESMSIAEQWNSPPMMISAWNRLADTYIVQERYSEGETAAMNAWKIDSVNMDMAPYVTYNLALTNLYLGNKEKAAYYFDKNREINGRLSDKSFQNLLVDMEVKYESEKKEMRITALEGERKLYVGLGIGLIAVLLLGTGLLFYRHRSAVQKQKIAEQQIKQLEQEKELIAIRSALDAEKAEREIIARDLHDGVGAMLSVVKNNMTIIKSYSIIENTEAEHFNRALDVLDKSIVELRRVSHHIMPATLVDKGLAIALDDFCRSIPEAEFHLPDSIGRFHPDKELALYRCAYELVNNALRHAKASHIDVHLTTDGKTVFLSIVDDGCGFDLQTTTMGMGINNLRTRLSALGGHIDIYSEDGKGTEINIELDI